MLTVPLRTPALIGDDGDACSKCVRIAAATRRARNIERRDARACLLTAAGIRVERLEVRIVDRRRAARRSTTRHTRLVVLTARDGRYGVDHVRGDQGPGNSKLIPDRCLAAQRSDNRTTCRSVINRAATLDDNHHFPVEFGDGDRDVELLRVLYGLD